MARNKIKSTTITNNTPQHDEGKFKAYMFRELAVGASQSIKPMNSIPEWPMMNCDGFRPIART